MGSGDWFKTIISRKKAKQKQDPSKKAKGSASEQANALIRRNHSHKVSNALCNGNQEDAGLTSEEVAARRIQTVYRGFRARKRLRHLKGLQRLKDLGQGVHIKKQTLTTLSYLQSWNKIQTEIRARRVCMVTEGHTKRKKQENQSKLEAKLHENEDWCGGSETMEEILARMQQREDAAVKRERAMAYAFSHQWRANSGGQAQFSYEFGNGNWGWSWVERWVAVRPWESRLAIQHVTSSEKALVKATSKTNTKSNTNAYRVATVRLKPAETNGKRSAKRVLPKSSDDKQVATSFLHKTKGISA